MGRRYKGHVPQEMLEDQGVPGKLYFEMPQVRDLVIRRHEGSTKVSIIDADSRLSACRLASTVALRDFSQKDLIDYELGVRPTLEEIKFYIRAAEIAGFGMGSIVARRWCADWRWETCQQWGMITQVHAYTANEYNGETYAPFTVRWLDRTTPEDKAWAEDLFVIHACMSKNLLASIVEEQEED